MILLSKKMMSYKKLAEIIAVPYNIPHLMVMVVILNCLELTSLCQSPRMLRVTRKNPMRNQDHQDLLVCVCVCVARPPVMGGVLLDMRYQSLVYPPMTSPLYPKAW